MQNFKYGKEVPEYVSMAKKNFPKHIIQNMDQSKQD